MTLTATVTAEQLGDRHLPIAIEVDAVSPDMRRGTIISIDGMLYTVTGVKMAKKLKGGGKKC